MHKVYRIVRIMHQLTVLLPFENTWRSYSSNGTTINRTYSPSGSVSVTAAPSSSFFFIKTTNPQQPPSAPNSLQPTLMPPVPLNTVDQLAQESFHSLLHHATQLRNDTSSPPESSVVPNMFSFNLLSTNPLSNTENWYGYGGALDTQ